MEYITHTEPSGQLTKQQIISRHLHLISMPSSLWAAHVDPKLEFVAFLYLNPSNLDKLTVDKALVLAFLHLDAVKATVFLNGEPAAVPELMFTIETVNDVSRQLYLLDSLKICDNNTSNVNCKRYVIGHDKNLCSACLPAVVYETFQEEFLQDAKITQVVKDDIQGDDKEKHKQFSCEICGKQFTASVHLKEHSRLHTGIRPYTCDVCHKSNTHRSTHRKHMLAHMDMKLFLCNICGKRFNGKYRMEDHMLTHAGDKQYECQICFKKFASANNLKIHQRTHTGDRPHMCATCGKSFTTPSNLATHIKSLHNEEKPHTCGICNMSFVYPRLLRIHMRKHTGEKPYTCSVCGRNFAKNIHLTVHMRTHTGERPFVCPICDKGFTTTGNLGSHRKVHHKEQASG